MDNATWKENHDVLILWLIFIVFTDSYIILEFHTVEIFCNNEKMYRYITIIYLDTCIVIIMYSFYHNQKLNTQLLLFMYTSVLFYQLKIIFETMFTAIQLQIDYSIDLILRFIYER